MLHFAPALAQALRPASGTVAGTIRARRSDLSEPSMSIVTQSYAPGLFAGRTALVTGGTSGIGLGAALALRDLGATVLATGATEAERIRAQEAPEHAGVRFAVLDVRDDGA